MVKPVEVKWAARDTALRGATARTGAGEGRESKPLEARPDGQPGLSATRPVALLLAPSRQAVSGVSTHLNSLLGSPLRRAYRLLHFQIGSEGRREGSIARVARLLASPCALGAQILRRRAALVHINTSLNFRAYWRDCVYMLTAKLCGARVLCQVHGGMIAQFLAGSRFKRWAVRATLALPDAVVVLSTAQREACRSLVPQQIVLAIPNGVDAQRYAPRVRTALDRRGPLKLLYVGRLTREKGLYETIEALSLERLLTVPVELIVAGSGEEEAGLRAFAASHRLERKVTFTGPVFGDDKIALLSAADAFVLPSYSEGLPYALLEAMASGLPAIVTAMGAIPDVMTPGVHGLFVGPRDPVAIADAVLRLSADRALLAAMSAACRQRIVESYTVERVAGEFEALYGRLCSGRRLRVVAR